VINAPIYPTPEEDIILDLDAAPDADKTTDVAAAIALELEGDADDDAKGHPKNL